MSKEPNTTIQNNSRSQMVMKGPQVVLVDGCLEKNGLKICEYGNGFNSSWSRFNFLNGKSGNDGHYMEYMVLHNLGMRYDRVLVLYSSSTSHVVVPNCEKLNLECGVSNKYVSSSIEESVDDYYYSTESEIQPVEQTLTEIEELVRQYPNESLCIIISAADEKIDDYHYVQTLQQELVRLYPRGNVVVANAEPMTAALTENKACFMYFQNPKTIDIHCLNLLTASAKKIQKIQQAAGNEPIVLKPIDNAEGYGVNVISPKDLPKYIDLIRELVMLRRQYPEEIVVWDQQDKIVEQAKKILKKYKMDEGLVEDRRISGWLYPYHGKEPLAVWQPCFSSKLINGQFATFRVNCIIYPDSSVELLGGFWKLALKKFDSTPSTDAIVNALDRSTTDFEMTSAVLSNEDFSVIKDLITPEVRSIYQNNIGDSLAVHIGRLHRYIDKDVKSIADFVNKTIILDQDKLQLNSATPYASSIFQRSAISSETTRLLQDEGEAVSCCCIFWC